MKMGGGNRLDHNKTQPQIETNGHFQYGERQRQNRDSTGGDVHNSLDSLEKGPRLGIVRPCVDGHKGHSGARCHCTKRSSVCLCVRTWCGKSMVSNSITVIDGSRVIVSGAIPVNLENMSRFSMHYSTTSYLRGAC